MTSAQAWIIIGLLAILVVGHLAFSWTRVRRIQAANEKQRFSVLFERDDLDELLKVSDETLRELPNHGDALYFRALALYKLDRLEESKELFQKLSEIDPAIRNSVREMVSAIDEELHKGAR